MNFDRDLLPKASTLDEVQGLKLTGRGNRKTSECRFHGGSDSTRINTDTGAVVCMAGCLDEETRSHITTAEAAFHLNRSEQTLRLWACKETGPLRPARINNRLAWSVAELRRVLGIH